jgi:dynein heavy chain
LLEIVEVVRKDITPLDRLTIEALIVIDVHNRDVVRNLVHKRVEKTTDFDW